MISSTQVSPYKTLSGVENVENEGNFKTNLFDEYSKLNMELLNNELDISKYHLKKSVNRHISNTEII